jgi:iron complex transport system ATP-binding protein
MIDGKDSAGLTGHQIAGHFAFIPQDVQTPAYLTVTELLELARFKPRQPFWRQASSHDLDVVMKCERLYGLERFSARQVESLSGGEVQRAWLAFALAQEKPFLLLDEALDALDTRARRRCFQTLKEVAANGRGVLLITHELALAQEFADLSVVLEKGEVIFFGAPDAALAHRLAALAE